MINSLFQKILVATGNSVSLETEFAISVQNIVKLNFTYKNKYICKLYFTLLL